MDSNFGILGELEVLQDGDLVQLGSPRQKALLARLLISRNATVTTDRLVEDLWGEEAPDTAKHTLHVYVSRLRKALGVDGERLGRQGPGYRFTIEPEELDASRFEDLAKEGRLSLARHDAESAASLLAEALGLWRGPALANFSDELFARDEAIRLTELRLTALEQRGWADLELGRHNEVVGELRDLVTQHPFRESLWEQLMLALYRCGRQADALRVYQTVRVTLAEELGIEPGPALRALEQGILNQDPSLDAGGATDVVRSSVELPLQRTSFVGRKDELMQGAALLDRSRLLTLTGPPGSGKTRLALRLAEDHAIRFTHGMFFVPLAATVDPHALDTTIANVLGLHEVPGERALDGVKAFLRNREALLILDNFEQILSAAPKVGEVLDAASRLKIMVTSRSPLRIAGEQEFPVPPLGVPPESTNLEVLSSYDAVALFVARSRAADPSFDLDSQNAPAVARITARVDGLPLAIELAAARVKLLTPQDLLGRLEKRLTLLTSSPTDASDRHRTMRDAIAWSYELLDPEEQTLFRRLGVFVGGFTLEAATAVADLPDMDVFDGVDSLLSRSLLYRPAVVGQARFAMLEMLREFALEQLTATGEKNATATRHARYFSDLAEQIEPELTRDQAGLGARRLAADIDNFRTVLRHALRTDDPDIGLILASRIWRYWQSSDQLIEGREWLRSLLELRRASEEARAKGLTALAGLAYWQADYDDAWTRYSDALPLYRSIGDRFNEADTLSSMSLTANWKGDLDAGIRLAKESLAIFEELGSREGVGRTLLAQGFSLWRQDEFAAAQALYEESLAIARETGDQSLASTLLLGVAILTFHQGMRNKALGILLEAIDEAAELENVHVMVWMLDFVAALSPPAAIDTAVRLAGAVDSLRRDAGGGILPESLGIENARIAAMPLLNPEALEDSWAQGRAMTIEEAIAAAHQIKSLGADG
jgi:predicted ATPase/DNA-binding winged helix-turn-helix (wHTH) protein